ncbi:TPA: integrase, partial [Escherichia coli]
GQQKTYNHSRYLQAKRDALNLWVERLDMIAGYNENIVILRGIQ